MNVDKMFIEPFQKPLWEKCLEELKEKIPESAFYTWFPNLEFVEISDSHLTIGTPNNFVLDYVSHHYKIIIQEAVQKVTGQSLIVHFANLDKACNSQYAEDSLPIEELPSESFESKPEQPFTEIDTRIQLNGDYTFDNFVIGDCNQLAQAACKAVSESPDRNNFNPLILYGGTGMGKTHLLHAICHFIADAETAKKVVYRTSEEFTREYIEFVHKAKDSRSFYRVYEDADVLLIDDIQFLANKNSTQEEFFNIFNNLSQLNKQIVITSDRLPSEIKGLHSRLLSRFDTGLLASMQPPDLETRLAILKKKQNNKSGVFLTEEILSYVANSVTSNIRELEGTLIKLTAYACFTKMPITVEIAKQILGDTVKYSNQPLNLRSILMAVSEEFNVSVSQLTSQSRKKNVAIPRHLAMYLARKLTDNSLHTIGFAFGRDYSTVIHSIKKVGELMDGDMEFGKKVQKIKDNLARNRDKFNS